MSDCRFGVSPVNYPDPDPDPTGLKMAGSSQQYTDLLPKGHPCGNRRTDRLRKNSFHLRFACRPLPQGLSRHRSPVPHGAAQQDLSPAPLDLGGP